jgi:hypothetical protein
MIPSESDAATARDAFLSLMGITDEHANIQPEDFRIAYEAHPEQMFAIFGEAEEGVSRMGSYETDEGEDEHGPGLSRSWSADLMVGGGGAPPPPPPHTHTHTHTCTHANTCAHEVCHLNLYSLSHSQVTRECACALCLIVTAFYDVMGTFRYLFFHPHVALA